MGFLESLGSGLRQGGLALAGGMSNEVFREQGQAIAQRKQDERLRQAKIAETILRAVHSGQVPDDQLPAARESMIKLGYDIPMAAFGATPEAKHNLAKYANEVAKQKRADDAAKQLMDYKFGGQPGLAPSGTTGLGIASQPGLAQLDAMKPRTMPQSSAGIEFTPDTFDSAPERVAPAQGAQSFPLDQDTQSEQFLSDNSREEAPQLENGAFQLAPVEVTARAPRTPAVPQQSVATPGINPAAPPVNIQAGTPDLDELYQRAMYAAQNGVPGGKEMLEYVIKMKESATKSDVIEVNGALVDKRTGKVVYQGQPKAAAQSGLGKLIAERDQLAAANPNHPMLAKYDEAINNFKTGITIENYGSPTQGIGPDGKPVFFQPSNKGGAPNVIEGVTPAPKEGKPLTESQAKATSFGMRAQAAHDAASQIEESSLEVGTLKQAAKDVIPGGNYVTSDDMQRYNQAKKEFINAAVLRQDSGAAISASEYEKYNKIYFPQPGDSKATIAQKAASRETAVQGLAIGAGEAGHKAQLRVQEAATPAGTKQRKTFKGVEYEEIGPGRWRKLTK
jgi:hypothetical protein